jgi:hypothetical protein
MESLDGMSRVMAVSKTNDAGENVVSPSSSQVRFAKDGLEFMVGWLISVRFYSDNGVDFEKTFNLET